MSDWQQEFPITGPPAGGQLYVGVACTNVPVGAQVRFTVPDPPLDSVWCEIEDSDVTIVDEVSWPPDLNTSITIYYDGPQPPSDATIQPVLMIPAGVTAPPEAGAAAGEWQQSFPLTGPDGTNDIVVGVGMFDIPAGSSVRFTLPGGGGVDPLDSGVHSVVSPNETFGIEQSWPSDYKTTMTLSFTPNGALAGDSALQPYLGMLIRHPKYVETKVIWKQRVTPQPTAA
jgi:hypothetical protein